MHISWILRFCKCFL